MSSPTRAILSFFSGTLLSRVSGMARDLLMAFIFADHPAVAAFMVAFRCSHLLRRVFGEGPLQSAFIPHFEGLRAADSVSAHQFFCKVSALLSLILIFIILIVEGGLWSSMHLFDLNPDTASIFELTAWMMPSLLFICLYGLNLSLLQCYEYFFVSSFAPFVCNLIWCIGIYALKDDEPLSAMTTLTQFTLAGFVAQWILTLPTLLRAVAKEKPHDLFKGLFNLTPEFKHLVRSFFMGTIGVCGVQLSVFLDSVLARYADLRGPAYLWYSIRLEQLAFALFGLACVGTIVPKLSRLIKMNDKQQAEELVAATLERIAWVMLPCTFALFALGPSSVVLIYGRGQFSDHAITQTTLCLWAYGLGLIPSTLVVLYSALFYAQGDFKTPMRFSLMGVGVSFLLNSILIFGFQLGAVSIAIATSASAWLNSFLLQASLRRMRWQITPPLKLVVDLLVIGFIASAAALAGGTLLTGEVNGVRVWTEGTGYTRDFFLQISMFSIETLFFVGAFAALSALWGYSWIFDLARKGIARFRRAPTPG